MALLSDFRGSGLIISNAERTKLGNLNTGFLGTFADSAALIAAHPTGADGEFAIVQLTNTVWLWDTATSAWVDTGALSFGDMTKAVYDPQAIAGDAFARANHTGTQLAATISDFATAVANNSAVAANTAASHTHSNSTILNAITDSGSGAIITVAERNKLAGIQAGATVGEQPYFMVTTANYTAAPGDHMIVDTFSAQKVITSPPAPAVGDVIRFADTGFWGSPNNLVVSNGGGLKIEGVASALTVNVANSPFGLVYTGTAIGWKIIN